MGGIAAVVKRWPGIEPMVRDALEAVPYRGSQIEIASIGPVSLGVSTDSRNPDASVALDGELAAALLGVLDNRHELFRQIEKACRTPVRNDSAARVILEAFRVWGPGACGRMRGDFVGIVSDGKTVWAFRDHLGATALFFRTDDKGGYFASEAKQVAVLAGRSREPNLTALEDSFFGRQSSGDPPALIQGVERVPPASLVSVNADGRRQTLRYWDPSHLVESSTLSATEAVERLVELLDQAVQRVLTGADAVALSGGIDSPVIAAFGAPAYQARFGRGLLAMSTVYPHAESVDESEYIRAVVEQLHMPWQPFVPEYRQLDDLQDWVDRFDGPVINVDITAVSEFLVRADALGIRTVLFGEHAELVFDLRRHLEGHLLLRGHLNLAAQLLAAKHHKDVSWARTLRGLLPTLVPGWIAGPLVQRRDQKERTTYDWVDPRFLPPVVRRWEFQRPPSRRWPDTQLHFAIAPSNAGMEAMGTVNAFHGVRIRRPFADLDLWEYFLSLPARLKQGDPVRKAIVREAVRGRLPDIILDRTDKTGFTEDVQKRVNYPALKKWILETDYRMKGIDYEIVGQRIDGGNLPLVEVNALNYLAGVHAFVSLWK